MENSRKYKPVPENVEGDFYVVDGCCTLCGVPDSEAPNNFGGYDKDGNVINDQCFVKKQPNTDLELKQVINAMAAQDTLCIRYCGKDKDIQNEIIKIGEGEQIDHRV